MNPQRDTWVETITLDGSGAGQLEFTARTDALIVKMVVQVLDASGNRVPGGSHFTVAISGGIIDGTDSGNFAVSETQHMMTASDVLTAAWTGSQAGAKARLTVHVVTFPAGTGLAAVYGR